MNYKVVKQFGGVAPVWHMVVLPEDDYFEYCFRIANYTHEPTKKVKKKLEEYVKQGFIPILHASKYEFIFEELDIPGNHLGIICQSAAEVYGMQ
jgi:hypothetical protein